jgi:hypothetical protein
VATAGCSHCVKAAVSPASPSGRIGCQGQQVDGPSQLATRASRKRLRGWPAPVGPRVLGQRLTLRRAAQVLAPSPSHGHQPRVLSPLTAAISGMKGRIARDDPRGRPAALLFLRYQHPDRAPLAAIIVQLSFDAVATCECRQEQSDSGGVGPMHVVPRERQDSRDQPPGWQPDGRIPGLMK